LFLKRHILRYFIYLVFAPLVVGLALRWPWLCLVLGICGEGYVVKAHRRLFFEIAGWQKLSLPKKVQAFIYVPIIRLVGDVAKMAGYPVGVIWRFRHKDVPKR
jgi:hypothetical protein